jgi:lysozyme family protein
MAKRNGKMNDERFNKLVGELLLSEGVHDNDPDDPGGDTWYGISRRSYPTEPWPPSRERAIEIYYTDWWRKGWLYRIVDDELAGELLDIAPNMGVVQAVKLLQAAVNKTKPERRIMEDGVLGPMTANAVNQHPNIWWLTDRFRLECIKFYSGLNRSKSGSDTTNRSRKNERGSRCGSPEK